MFNVNIVVNTHICIYVNIVGNMYIYTYIYLHFNVSALKFLFLCILLKKDFRPKLFHIKGEI